MSLTKRQLYSVRGEFILYSKRMSYILIAVAAAAAPAPYALVRFDIDECLSVVPTKRIANTKLTVGEKCRVKWSASEEFNALILAMGKLNISLNQ